MVKKGKMCMSLLLAFLLLMLGGCADSSGASAGKIIPPSSQVNPLSGKWTVLQELDGSDGGGGEIQQWAGSDVQFASDVVAFGGHVWDKLSYKIKRVNSKAYLATKYISSYNLPAGISLPQTGKVDVITVYAAANYLGEFMKLDETSLIFFVQNKVLALQKVSDQVDGSLGAANANAQDLNPNNNEGTSGVLLGLRLPKDGEGEGYTYQTLWLAVDHHQLHPVLASEQLFFPRTSGFWELSVQEEPSGAGKTSNLLNARNVAAKTPNLKAAEAETENELYSDQAERIINYLGNDYVSIEKRTVSSNQLQVLPVDKLSSSTEIKVSDLLGDNGLNAYLSARAQAVETLKDQGVTAFNPDESGENFGLARNNGHWFVVGRVNYQKDGTSGQSDFDLKVIPPVNLIFYDTLVLSWHNIKDRVPDALDAFTSPNRDFALVKTKNKLTIYPIGTEQLAETPLAELDLPEGAAVIMAEWATGSYVDSWEKSFLAYGAQALSGNSVRVR